MKRFLIPLVLCCTAIWSCDVKSTYSASNVYDIVTAEGKYLVNDYGVMFNVVSNESTVKNWQEEGARYFMNFDILNQDMDITIKSLDRFTIFTPQDLPEDGLTTGDPIIMQFARLSTFAVDLNVAYYRSKTSTFTPVLSCYSEGSKLYLHLDGNGENPVNMDKEQLITESRFISIPLTEAQKADLENITLSADVLAQDDNGEYVIYPYTGNVAVYY